MRWPDLGVQPTAAMPWPWPRVNNKPLPMCTVQLAGSIAITSSNRNLSFVTVTVPVGGVAGDGSDCM